MRRALHEGAGRDPSTTQRLSILCALAITAGCHSAPLPPPETAHASLEPSPTRAAMLVLGVVGDGLCVGGCRAYSVRLYDDGLLVYTGHARMGGAGEQRDRLSAETMLAIGRALEDAHFFELDDCGEFPRPVATADGTSTYDFEGCMVCSDTETIRVTYERAGRRRTLDVPCGTRARSTVLGRLYERLFSMLRLGAWVDPPVPAQPEPKSPIRIR